MYFFFLMFLKAIFIAHLFWIVTLPMPIGSIRDYSTFAANGNFKVIPSATCIPAANAACRDIDIFNKDCITLKNIVNISN
jgi:hypothetical protein